MAEAETKEAHTPDWSVVGPDLLEALKHVMGWIDGWDPNFIHDPEWPEAKHHIRAAISRAEA